MTTPACTDAMYQMMYRLMTCYIERPLHSIYLRSSASLLAHPITILDKGIAVMEETQITELGYKRND